MRRIISSWRIVLETLREIFDEAQYSRFLSRYGIESSRQAYAEFRREVEDAKVRPVKCC